MLWYYIFSCNFMIQFYYNFEAEDRPTGVEFPEISRLRQAVHLFQGQTCGLGDVSV